MNIQAHRTLLAGIFAVAIFQSAATASAEEKVTLSDMHVCCPSCVKAIQTAAATVPGLKCTASQDDYTATLSADNLDTLQKGVDALVKAGFCGTPDNKNIKIADVKAPEGKVTKLEIAHVHNCCGKCTAALKDALSDVKGITSNTLEPKKTSFVLEGDFAAGDVVKALVKAGFYPELKEAK
jgi:periplasmic mercuric ion binding protein